MAALKRRQYCLGEMTVGSLPAPPPRITEDFTHVSSCLSQVYCRQQHAGVQWRQRRRFSKEKGSLRSPCSTLECLSCVHASLAGTSAVVSACPHI